MSRVVTKSNLFVLISEERNIVIDCFSHMLICSVGVLVRIPHDCRILVLLSDILLNLILLVVGFENKLTNISARRLRAARQKLLQVDSM